MRTLFFDIESTDLSADIGNILCIGYKWSDEKTTHIIDIVKYPGKTLADDSGVLREFEKVYLQADVVVFHFGEYFDLPFIQTRRLIHGMKPLPVVTAVDTWRIAKKRLKFGSNRLERILDVLKCPYKKTPVALSIWAKARVGDRNALKYIIEHCYKDVKILEWVYNKIKSVWDRHPRVMPITNAPNCPVCGGVGKSEGIRANSVHTYRRMVCKKCGFNWKAEKLS